MLENNPKVIYGKRSNFLVLFVDDSRVNHEVITKLINDGGLDIISAFDGKQAIETANQRLPDLILLAIIMPGMDGYEVCEELKSNSQTKDIPVIFLTSKLQSEDINKGFEVGAVDYITKPYNTTELLLRISTHLKIKSSKDILEKKNINIAASINAAKRIQNAILPSDQQMKELLQEYFVLFKPRDVVSGDFYWMKQIENQIVVAAADCTGHGVPGAFTSMLSIALLNDIVRRPGILRPDLVLNELRKEIKTSLRQSEKQHSAKDGMDIALCIINIENMEMQFAGANRPLCLIRNNEIIYIKPDRMPIAIYLKEKPFTNHKSKLQVKDIIYIYSDGYSDQFGGKKNEKFQSVNFRQLLLEIHKKDLAEQKEILDRTFNEWKGVKNKQLDDVLVIGIKIMKDYGDVDFF